MSEATTTTSNNTVAAHERLDEKGGRTPSLGPLCACANIKLNYEGHTP